MLLSPHFTVEELTRTGEHTGIDNTPPEKLNPNGVKVAAKLEQARAIWSKKMGRECRVFVPSSFRCLALNTAVGGSKTSAHMEWLAADAVPEGMELRAAFDALVEDPEFMVDVDQLIIERGCVHFGFATALHEFIPRHELRLDQDVHGVRTYPLYGHWTPEGVIHA